MGPDLVVPLCFRTRPEGGNVASRACDRQLDILRLAVLGGPRRTVLLLIHGYNNTLDEGDRSYDWFFRLQRESIGDKVPIAPGTVFVPIYWPGDGTWGIFRGLFYMNACRYVPAVVKMISESLQRISDECGGIFVRILAHSMGCRIAVDLVNEVFQAGNRKPPRLSRMALMAAAVPVKELEAGGRLRAAMEDEFASGVKPVLSLYSESDLILSLAFPLGETLAGEGLLPTALGHAYWVSRPSLECLDQVRNPEAGHSDYWGAFEDDEERKHARFVAANLRTFFGFALPPTASTPARATASATEAPTRGLEDRTIPSRTPGTPTQLFERLCRCP